MKAWCGGVVAWAQAYRHPVRVHAEAHGASGCIGQHRIHRTVGSSVDIDLIYILKIDLNQLSHCHLAIRNIIHLTVT